MAIFEDYFDRFGQIGVFRFAPFVDVPVELSKLRFPRKLSGKRPIIRGKQTPARF